MERTDLEFTPERRARSIWLPASAPMLRPSIELTFEAARAEFATRRQGIRMIDLHFTSGPNGRKVAIMLEELGLPYRLIQHNIGKGDLLTEEFRKLNPNGRVPVLVDDEPIGGGTDPITVWESAACLQYLAEKTGRFLPIDAKRRYATLRWLAWQIASLGPSHGQAAHFTRYAPEPIDPYARQRFRLEGERL